MVSSDNISRFKPVGDVWPEMDMSSPDAASSSYDPSAGNSVEPCRTTVPRGAPTEKREPQGKDDDDEMPEKSQGISTVVVGYGAADKTGEAPCVAEYASDLQLMAEDYQNRDWAGECFVHIGKKHSSNRDLRALKEIPREGKLYSVSLKGKETESILTSSAHLANKLRRQSVNPVKISRKLLKRG